jgi:hypothetical protein
MSKALSYVWRPDIGIGIIARSVTSQPTVVVKTASKGIAFVQLVLGLPHSPIFISSSAFILGGGCPS